MAVAMGPMGTAKAEVIAAAVEDGVVIVVDMVGMAITDIMEAKGAGKISIAIIIDMM
jgi:hypothetical protein